MPRLFAGLAGLPLAMACLLVIAVPTVGCADEDALQQAIESCSRQVAADGDTGNQDAAGKAIGERCPAVVAALQASGLSVQLGEGWQRRIKPAQLPDIEWLEQQYARAPSAEGPDPGALAPILANLHPAAEQSQSWWSRGLNWLRHLMSGQSSTAPAWAQALFNTLKRTPGWVVKAVFYAGLTVVVALVSVLLWREARIFWSNSRHARATRRVGATVQPAAESRITLAEVDAAPLRERPVLLLRLLIQTLVAQRLLSGERALTHSELATRASFADTDQRQRFARIAQLAEARRFAANRRFEQQHADDEIDAALVDGRTLYSQLRVAGAAGGPKPS